MTIKREAAKQGSQIKYVTKERLDQMSETGRHQGVIADAAAYGYAEVSDILQRAKEKGEEPFVLLLDGIEDPHNLGAIIRTANQAGAHGVIIPKKSLRVILSMILCIQTLLKRIQRLFCHILPKHNMQVICIET